jgi:hypothetical protein
MWGDKAERRARVARVAPPLVIYRLVRSRCGIPICRAIRPLTKGYGCADRTVVQTSPTDRPFPFADAQVSRPPAIGSTMQETSAGSRLINRCLADRPPTNCNQTSRRSLPEKRNRWWLHRAVRISCRARYNHHRLRHRS